jgi:hypothetical protein
VLYQISFVKDTPGYESNYNAGTFFLFKVGHVIDLFATDEKRGAFKVSIRAGFNLMKLGMFNNKI